MRLSILLVMVVAVGLALTNPTMVDFENFAKEHSEGLIERETGNSALGKALSGAGSNIVSSYVDQLADRDNYVVYSVYTINMGPEMGEWRFVGVADNFVEIERPEALQGR